MRDLASTSAVNLLVLNLGLITAILTARGLGPAERGLLVALITWMGMSASLALVGLDEALIYVSKGRGRAALGLRNALASRALLQSACGMAAMFFIGWWLIRPHALGEWALALIITINVPLNTLALMSLSVLRVDQRLGAWNATRIVPNIFYAASLGLLVIFNELTLARGIFSLLAGGALAAVISLALVANKQAEIPPDADISEASRFGARLTLATLAANLNPRVDLLLMSLLLAPTVLGVYSIAAALASIVLVLASSLEQVLYPRMVAGRASGSLICALTAFATLAGLVLSAALWTIGPELIEVIFGDEYVSASGALPLLLAAASVRAGVGVLTAAAKAGGQLRVITSASVIGLAVGALGFVALAPWGMTGVALSSLLAALSTLGILVHGAILHGGDARSETKVNETSTPKPSD